MTQVVLKNDFSGAIDIIRAAAVWREENGFHPGRTWNVKDMTPEGLLKMYSGAKKEDFFVALIDDKEIFALILLDADVKKDWEKFEDGRSHYYLHKFSRKPENRKSRHSDDLLKFLQQKTKDDKFASIRIDLYQDQLGLVELYSKNGFKQVLDKISLGREWVLMEWNNPNLR